MRKYHFEGAYPSPGEIRKMNAENRHLQNYIYPERLAIAVRRDAFTFDALVQPDIRRLIRRFEGIDLKPVMNQSKKRAEEAAAGYVETIRNFAAKVEELMGEEEIRQFETDILWGRYQLVMESDMQWGIPLSPYYYHIDRRKKI
ncbi:MAG: hypothetical protein J5935_04990 [Lachnospiraceae bacterium]|nr:hypothetical protein [Lachnospiraceae bacterium]